MQSMSDGQRYHLLKHHAQPSESYKFPTQCLGGANQSFKLWWIEEYGWWLVYSFKLYGALCICSALLPKERKNMGAMLNAPFWKWCHKFEITTAHVSKPWHVAAFQAAEDLIHSIDNPEAIISALVDRRKAENVAENSLVLKCVAEAILYFTRQCIALRGGHEKLVSLGYPRNFYSLKKMIATHNGKLKQHLDMPKLKNATHLSPETQNEIIDVIGKRMIQSKIVQEVKYTNLHNHGQWINLWQYWIDASLHSIYSQSSDYQGRVARCSSKRITRLHVANKIKHVLGQLDLNISDCRGQGYDGASSMSSDQVGSQALIRQECTQYNIPTACGTCLSLVVEKSCSLPVVHNTLNKMKAMINYFINNLKRERLLSKVAKKEGHPLGQRNLSVDDGGSSVHVFLWNLGMLQASWYMNHDHGILFNKRDPLSICWL